MTGRATLKSGKLHPQFEHMQSPIAMLSLMVLWQAVQDANGASGDSYYEHRRAALIADAREFLQSETARIWQATAAYHLGDWSVFWECELPTFEVET